MDMAFSATRPAVDASAKTRWVACVDWYGTVNTFLPSGQRHSVHGMPALANGMHHAWYDTGKLHRDGNGPTTIVVGDDVDCSHVLWHDGGVPYRYNDDLLVPVKREEGYFCIVDGIALALAQGPLHPPGFHTHLALDGPVPALSKRALL